MWCARHRDGGRRCSWVRGRGHPQGVADDRPRVRERPGMTGVSLPCDGLQGRFPTGVTRLGIPGVTRWWPVALRRVPGRFLVLSRRCPAEDQEPAWDATK